MATVTMENQEGEIDNLQTAYPVDPTPTPTPGGDPSDLVTGNMRLQRVTASFSAAPPPEVREPTSEDTCGCIDRTDEGEDVTVMNRCAGEAKMSLMKYPREPLTAYQALPFADSHQVRSDTSYAAISMPPRSYLRMHNTGFTWIETKIRACSTG